MCLSQPRTKSSWVFTQYIEKPLSINYPIRVFVQISYGISQCEHQMQNCDSFELLSFVTNSEDPQERVDEENYHHSDLNPDSEIPTESRGAHNSTTTLYIDLGGPDRGLYLAVESDERMCVTIGRLVVYINTCPSVENGLSRYPVTASPLTGSVSVVGQCAANAHHTTGSVPDSLLCDFLGEWSSDQTLCECDSGYYREGNNCRGIICNNKRCFSYVKAKKADYYECMTVCL